MARKRSLIHSISTRRLDLGTLLKDVCGEYQEPSAHQGVEFELDIPDNLWVELDPILMRDAFRKVIENALDAMPSGGCITVTSLVGRFGLEVEFADSGEGLPDAFADHLFEPFTTSREDRAGLGLSLVRDVATAHHATVSLAPCPDGGAALTFMFPLRQAARQAA